MFIWGDGSGTRQWMDLSRSTDNQLTWITSAPDDSERHITWYRHAQAAPPSTPIAECFVVVRERKNSTLFCTAGNVDFVQTVYLAPSKLRQRLLCDEQTEVAEAVPPTASGAPVEMPVAVPVAVPAGSTTPPKARPMEAP
jgi:hypothetical protein